MFLGKGVDVVVSLPTDRDIVFSCQMERSARRIFDAWTRPEHLKRWWGCEGSTITQCSIDLRVGGSWRLVMRMADGSDHPFHGVYGEIARPQRLVYTECYDEPRFGRPEWLTTVTLEERGSTTALTHRILHRSRELRDGHLQAGMQEGAIQTLARLHDYIEHDDDES
jgi:uncharacterized protein YndB with AHSA1/START domain